jgi:hypothetical protein
MVHRRQSTLSDCGRHATGDGSCRSGSRVCVCTCIWGKAFFVCPPSFSTTDKRPLAPLSVVDNHILPTLALAAYFPDFL